MALQIKQGDTVCVKCKGYHITGKVLTAHNWKIIPDDHDDWYIELTGQHGYAYWKQGVDGGTVELVSD